MPVRKLFSLRERLGRKRLPPDIIHPHPAPPPKGEGKTEFSDRHYLNIKPDGNNITVFDHIGFTFESYSTSFSRFGKRTGCYEFIK